MQPLGEISHYFKHKCLPPRAASLRSAVCSSYSPLHKDELVADTLAGELVLKVVDGPPALLLGELGNKLLKVAAGGRLEDDDRPLVLREAVDDVGKLLPSLELLVLLNALLGLFGEIVGTAGSRKRRLSK